MTDFQTEILIHQLKANSDFKTLLRESTNLLDPEMRKMLVWDLYANENSTHDFLVDDLLAIDR